MCERYVFAGRCHLLSRLPRGLLVRQRLLGAGGVSEWLLSVAAESDIMHALSGRIHVSGSDCGSDAVSHRILCTQRLGKLHGVCCGLQLCIADGGSAVPVHKRNVAVRAHAQLPYRFVRLLLTRAVGFA